MLLPLHFNSATGTSDDVLYRRATAQPVQLLFVSYEETRRKYYFRSVISKTGRLTEDVSWAQTVLVTFLYSQAYPNMFPYNQHLASCAQKCKYIFI